MRDAGDAGAAYRQRALGPRPGRDVQIARHLRGAGADHDDGSCAEVVEICAARLFTDDPGRLCGCRTARLVHDTPRGKPGFEVLPDVVILRRDASAAEIEGAVAVIRDDEERIGAGDVDRPAAHVQRADAGGRIRGPTAGGDVNG